MEIVENLDAWYEAFEQGWLKSLRDEGKVDFSLYKRPKNEAVPSAPGIDLSQSKLMLISTAGGYLKDSQERFDEHSDYGDYSVRSFSSDTPFDAIDFAHTHYDRTAVFQDPQVLLPLEHLRNMVADGKIGSLSDVASICGYQPDVRQVVRETIPPIVEMAKAAKIDGALLVPA
ncbi:MAG: glycine/sarcosine/betaine reductase selenoprotein B family protein [Chloroflexota bacterium]